MKLPTHQLIVVLVALVIDSVHLQQFPPNFPQNAFKIIPENLPNGSLITSFNVTDSDSTSITLGIADVPTRQSVSLTQTNDRPGVVTGHIYLINPHSFDFDRGFKEVKLAFSATDDQQNTVTGFVTVYVTDVNDNCPVFRRPAYIYNIPENSSYPSTHNASIEATDADEGANKNFIYRLNATGQSSELYKDVFTINPQTGLLSLQKSLDYETLSFYQYIIEAVDSGNPSLTGTAEITIKVTDVQDTPPNFQGLPYIFTIQENSFWPGKKILAQDGDRGVPRHVQYEMVDASENCSKLFEINTNGSFSIKDPFKLDRDSGIVLEKQGICTIDIKAKEKGEPTTNSTASTTVTVMVEDIDDNVPTFNKSHYDAYIEEGVSNIPMTIVGSTGIEVYDLDQGLNSKFSLTVKYTNGTKFPGIEATPSVVLSQATVLLRLTNGFEFDYETEQNISLVVVATETINASLSATCTVTVHINNTNDNDPIFNQTEYKATIPENRPANTSVTVVTADDADLDVFGKLTYTLKGAPSTFDIDPVDGTVYTVGSDLDREIRDTYFLTVVATDGGDRRAVALLTVTLSDVNDNAPEFLSDTIQMSLTENTTEFIPNILIEATDRDEKNTNNSEVMYKLQCPDNLETNFTINVTTGEILVTKPLDYERLNQTQDGQIHLIVIAYNNGTPCLETNNTVTINAHDINDNTPKFEQESYNTSIPENSPSGTSVSTVSASDDDATSPNNEVRYYIEKGGSDLFRINGLSGIITVDLNAKIDREVQSEYNLTVIAADIGTPPMTGTVTLAVTITDINDVSPEFHQSSYEAKTKEDIAIRSIIKNCTATDVDEDNELEYDIQTDSATDGNGNIVNISLVEHMFDIHPTNGSVFVSDSLDREIASQISLIITVNDTRCAAKCPQTSTALLTVFVEDVNDVPPKFTQAEYRGSVPESASPDTIVITVTANDVDTVGPDPIYTLLSDTDGPLTIEDKSSGTITTNQKLDRETEPELNITVVASDGLNNSTCIVIVEVTDVNDNAPEFLPFVDHVNVTEGNYTNVPLYIATVNATDADEGVNAIVKYRLEKNFHDSFSINDTTGEIWAVGDIDRERTSPHIGVFELNIIAENHKNDPENLRNKTKLMINVLDINDNYPKFSNPTSYEESVKEMSVKHGSPIVQVTATDSDYGKNGTAGIRYDVVGGLTNGTSYFFINHTTGWIYANSTMVDNVGTFLLNVTATDGGQPPLVSNVKVYIIIEDENNNAPVFHFYHQINGVVIYSILECEPNGTKIATTNATDGDVGQNGKIKFSFARELDSDPGPFVIDGTTGVIKLNGTVSNERKPEYMVKINATDNGTPKPLSTLSPTVRILIKDVNDKPPNFTSPTASASVMENTANVSVTTVVAIDDDADSVTIYSIIRNVGPNLKDFAINETTGLVTILRPLDRELTPTVNITVEARDASLRNETCNGTGGPVAITDTQVVIVTLDDENDSPPVFRSNEFNVGIRKNVKQNTIIFDFVNRVDDNDTDINSVHSFEIQGDIKMPPRIAEAVNKAPLCKDTQKRRAVCLSSNGTITTNIVFEEDMQGEMKMSVVARDEAGNSTAILTIDIIVDSQMARMIFVLSKQEVEDVKGKVTDELTVLTGYKFVPEEVSAYIKDNGVVDVTQSVLTFYVKDKKDGRILSAKEITDLVDRFGSNLIVAVRQYGLVSIEEAFKTPVEEVDERFKQTMILAGATVLEAIIICILVAVACRSQGKFKRKLKAATVTTKDEKDSAVKKSSIVPGSNVYASMTNPMLNKEVPTVTEFDRISDTDSQNSLDSNEVGTEGMAPDYQRTEEKEAVMDMYTEDFYQPDGDTDPLQMVLSMHEMERKEQNGLTEEMEEDDFQYDFDNVGFQLETTEV